MIFKEISYSSPEYREMWQLREDVLRKPLGRTLNDEDLSFEASNDVTLIVALNSKEDVVGCLILQRINIFNVKMRQVAVAESQQGKGVGAKMVKFAEQVAEQKGFSKLFLHVRLTAKEFYQKLGYKVTSEEYIEVGVPHVSMEKSI